MAYTPDGGAITAPAVATNLIDLLVAAGIIADHAPLDKGGRAHRLYHVLSFRSDTGNAAAIFLGHKSTLANTGAARSIALYAKDQYTEDLVEGTAPLEAWWVVGNGSDVLFVHWVE